MKLRHARKTSNGPAKAAQAALYMACSCAALAVGLIGIGTAASAQDARPNRIQIEYIPPTNPEFQSIYDTLKQRKVLEKLQQIFGAVRLPVDLSIKTKQCGMSNAWYQRPTLTICYEYLADILKTLPKEDAPSGVTQTDAILGQFYYVVFHEMGHALFDALNVPLFGRPEDAADGFAAYLMLHMGSKEDAHRLITGAAYTYKNDIQGTKVTAPLQAFSDVHGAPAQRFYNLLCMAFGADPGTFSDLVDKGYLPQGRAKTCRVEYGELNFAFQQLIKPHLDPDLTKAVLQQSWLPDESAPPPIPPAAPSGAN
jgi:Putative metallopeptidase